MFNSATAYNIVGVIVAVITLSAVLIYGRYKTQLRITAEQKRRSAIDSAYLSWWNGDVFPGQVYDHRKGKYLLVSITNTLCDDKYDWPLMAVYCDISMCRWYTRPLHEFLRSRTLDKSIDNSAVQATDELMAMANVRIDPLSEEKRYPEPESMWYVERNWGPITQRDIVVVTDVFNKGRAQPIVAFYNKRTPHVQEAVNLFQFLRTYTRTQQEQAA